MKPDAEGIVATPLRYEGVITGEFATLFGYAISMNKRIALLILAALVVAALGCKPKAQTPDIAPPEPTATNSEPSPAPMGVGAGAATPMANTESVGGTSGGGTGQAAKNQARSAAAKAGGSSVNAAPAEGE